jgi:hypothetical protein
VGGMVNIARATFHGPAVFGSPPGTRGTIFTGNADFTLSNFDSVVTFERAVFIRPANFTLARFGGDAIFAGGRLIAPASFKRASFAAIADFRNTQFQSVSHFEQVEFKGLADFSQARFTREARFTRARFVTRGTFFGAQFTDIGPLSFAVLFDHASSGGALNFSSAQFGGHTSFRSITASSLSFAGASFFTDHKAVFEKAAADDVVMDVDVVENAVQTSDRRHVLELVEFSAKSRSDLAVANDAHYDLEVISSDGYAWPWRILDQIFYRGIAGYFVRPLRPLIALLLLVAIFALIRTFGPRPTSRPRLSGTMQRRWRIRNVRANSHRFATEFLDAISLVGRRTSAEDPPLRRRLEVFTYRVLIVCALLGLANSNPALRQMFDALA